MLNGRHCRCEACQQLFNSASVFDAHRVGDWKERGSHRRCLTVAEMSGKGWLTNAAGFWISGRMPMMPRFASASHAGAAIGADPLSAIGPEANAADSGQEKAT